MRHLWPLLACACISDPGAIELDLTADFGVFAEQVQPALAMSCANPSCHGAKGRPLELYAVHQHRLEAADVHLDAPLNELELQLNYLRSCGFLVDLAEPESCMLLSKPLAEHAGGVHHAGGDQFIDASNPDYQRIFAWIDAALEERQ